MLRQATARRTALLLRSSNTATTTAYTASRITLQKRLASSGGNSIVPPPPSQKSRSWRNRLIRLGLAGAAIYYYNTSSVFAEEPVLSLRPQPLDSEEAPTLAELSRKTATHVTEQPTSSENVLIEQPNAPGQEGDEGIEGLESQAEAEGAFNPETGEINWDCPCLGGMAHGPCGEEFKAAFSCFVYSTEEPKGMDCIEKFKGMQDCFRQHPDVYGSELEEEEVDEQLTEQIAQRDKEDQARKEQQQQQPQQEEKQEEQITTNDPARSSLNQAEKHAETEELRKANEHSHQSAQQEEDLVPRAWHASEGEDVKKTEK